MVALTATATKETSNYIIDSLNLIDPFVISSLPDANNIKYLVLNFEVEPVELFEHYIKDLQINLYKSQRVIVFCRRMKDVRKLFKFFNVALGHIYHDFTTRPYAMFHSKTSDTIKNYILDSFSKHDGKIRFLIATVAFGMGVDCKGLNYIFHYGPPSTTEDYFQQTGRAGRDGKQSFAILINFPGCLRSKNISKAMKSYVKNTAKC